MEYIDKLDALRDAKGLSFRKLGLECELSESAIKKILYKKCAPRIPTLEKLCAALGTSLSELFCETDEIVIKITDEIFTLGTVCVSLPTESKPHFLQFIETLHKN